MVKIAIEAELWQAARSHLDASAERVGFFLADWLPVDRCFAVHAWRPINDGAVGFSDDVHVELPDDARQEVIKWASVAGGCLIEAHSHGRWSPAAFSPYDLRGLDDWVQHLWWRLPDRPYAAIVTSHIDFDALAWIAGPAVAEQVDGVIADGYLAATKATLQLNVKE